MKKQPFDYERNCYTGFFILYPKHENQGYDHWLTNAKKDAAEYDHFETHQEGLEFCEKNNIPADYVVPVQWIVDMT